MYSDHKNNTQQQKRPFLYVYYLNLICDNIFDTRDAVQVKDPAPLYVVAACFSQKYDMFVFLA